MRQVLLRTWDLFCRQLPDDQPRDITGPEVVPDVGDGVDPTLWMAFAVAAAGILGAILFTIMNRRRRIPQPSETITARSLRQLERLERIQLFAKGHAERHFTLLAGILRRYIARRYSIAAPRQTSDEFLVSAATCGDLNKDFEFLKRFLTECDVAKFAPPAALNGQGSRLTAELRDWLSRQNAPIPSPPLDAASAPSKMIDS